MADRHHRREISDPQNPHHITIKSNHPSNKHMRKTFRYNIYQYNILFKLVTHCRLSKKNILLTETLTHVLSVWDTRAEWMRTLGFARVCLRWPGSRSGVIYSFNKISQCYINTKQNEPLFACSLVVSCLFIYHFYKSTFHF